MQKLLQDLRYSFRRLRKSPGFALIAILSLGLGIGANTAIFSLVNTVLLRPLPVDHPEQLVTVYGTLNKGAEDTIFSYQNYKDVRDRNEVFAGTLAYRFAPMSLSHTGSSERVWGYLVSGNYFDVLGVKAMLGRTFQPAEDRTKNAAPVAVMSYGCWQRRFASDPTLPGKTILVNGRNFTIIGIAPKDFVGTEIAFAPELFIPFMMAEVIEPGSDYLEGRRNDNIFVAGRLKNGVTRQQADASLTGLMQQLAKEYPKENEGRGVKILPVGFFLPQIRDSVIAFSWVLMAVVGLVLLIACVNLANLLLARATERRKEIAIRLAIGANRWQLIRQLLIESVLLSLIGGALGLLLALWINDFVANIKLPADVTLIFDLRIDWRVMVFTVGLSLLTGIVFGLLPAWQASKPDLIAALKNEVVVTGFRHFNLRSVLVVAQMSLSLLLLICAGLIVRSLQKAQEMKPGFNPDHALAMTFDVGLQGYDEARGRVFHQQLLERVKALPGIKSATLAQMLPLALNFNSSQIYIEGQPAVSPANLPLAVTTYVMPDYFETMDIRLQGRDFTAQDKDLNSRSAIVNETFARRFYAGQNPIGKRFNFDGPASPYWEIIGVAADGKYVSLGEEPKLAVYRPMLRDYSSWTVLIARTTQAPQTMIAAVRNEIRQLDPTLPVVGEKTLQEHMNVPLFPARVAGAILGSFGILALILAAIGIYGVMAYSVAQRTREIGIRMALGAMPRDVLRLVAGQGMRLVAIGIVIGGSAAIALTSFISSLLYNVGAKDPVTFLIVTILLGGIAFCACLIPAWRAARVNPIKALKYE